MSVAPGVWTSIAPGVLVRPQSAGVVRLDVIVAPSIAGPPVGEGLTCSRAGHLPPDGRLRPDCCVAARPDPAPGWDCSTLGDRIIDGPKTPGGGTFIRGYRPTPAEWTALREELIRLRAQAAAVNRCPSPHYIAHPAGSMPEHCAECARVGVGYGTGPHVDEDSGRHGPQA